MFSKKKRKRKKSFSDGTGRLWNYARETVELTSTERKEGMSTCEMILLREAYQNGE